MSKKYKVSMNIDTSKLHPNGGFLMKPAPKDEKELEAGQQTMSGPQPWPKDTKIDKRGFAENTGPEIFATLSRAALQGSNRKVSYLELKNFRRLSGLINDSIDVGSFEANKTEIDLMKASVENHNGWVNSDEMEIVLDALLNNLKEAQEV